MKKAKVRVASLGLAFALTFGVASTSFAATNNRLAGDDRFETSVEVAKETFETAPEVVLLASGMNYADALVANGLAGDKSPILLTNGKELSDSAKEYLADAEKVVVIGGENSVSKDLATELEKDFEVERVAGTDRYDTSVKVYDAIVGTEVEKPEVGVTEITGTIKEFTEGNEDIQLDNKEYKLLGEAKKALGDKNTDDYIGQKVTLKLVNGEVENIDVEALDMQVLVNNFNNAVANYNFVKQSEVVLADMEETKDGEDPVEKTTLDEAFDLVKEAYDNIVNKLEKDEKVSEEIQKSFDAVEAYNDKVEAINDMVVEEESENLPSVKKDLEAAIKGIDSIKDDVTELYYISTVANKVADYNKVAEEDAKIDTVELTKIVEKLAAKIDTQDEYVAVLATKVENMGTDEKLVNEAKALYNKLNEYGKAKAADSAKKIDEALEQIAGLKVKEAIEKLPTIENLEDAEANKEAIEKINADYIALVDAETKVGEIYAEKLKKAVAQFDKLACKTAIDGLAKDITVKEGELTVSVKEALTNEFNKLDNEKLETEESIKANKAAIEKLLKKAETIALVNSDQVKIKEGYTAEELTQEIYVAETIAEINAILFVAVEVIETPVVKEAKTFLASGVTEADALVASSVSGRDAMPILLTTGKGLTEDVADRLAGDDVTIVGGENTVEKTILDGVEVKEQVRVAGATRELTSVEIADKFYGKQNAVVVANGYKPSDALVSGPLAVKLEAPILLVQKDVAENEVKDLIKEVETLKVVGGPSSISEELVKELEELVK